ncbi:cytochrome c oxidase subunit II [Kordiimonas lacus]|uniref:Cytochrome c oxidase subunit 2 n=1 Tax=Kordiimonas lacus TaxID=637679 RepID=A0A1G7B5H4_9PROT|nr:cytochrome c oxidase subunit II [Kordiimonas lacus]SDE22263.1 cytochrome c oxidase subunit 2 [Kordiimonas lacus]
MNVKRLTAGVMAAWTALFGFTVSALAEGVIGTPDEKGVWLQEPVNEQAARVVDFNELLLWIITVITIFVFALMFYVMVRYRAKANPEPSKTSHNTLIEIIWTVVPIGVLVVIGFWSIPLLYFQDVVPKTEFAIRVTGNQWNWTYSYPDHGDIEFTSTLVPNEAYKSSPSFDPAVKAEYEAGLTQFLGKPAQLNARLLDTNNRLVVPVDTKIKVMLTATDVIHAWTIQKVGIKLDAVPGRLNETWFEINKEGTYYGQCSELCGKDHAFMPITVEAVSKEEFAKWVERAKAAYADAGTTALGR